MILTNQRELRSSSKPGHGDSDEAAAHADSSTCAAAKRTRVPDSSVLDPNPQPARVWVPSALTSMTPAVRTIRPAEADQTGSESMGSKQDREIGRRVHALIAAMVPEGRPGSRQIWLATAAMFKAKPMAHNGSCRQRAATGLGVYFGDYYRPEWDFIGAEVDLGTGRVDLVWRTSTDDRIVIDEVKMAGSADVVDDQGTVAQVERYNAAAVGLFGDRFAGVRLLPLAAPGRGLWCAPGAPRVALARSGWGTR